MPLTITRLLGYDGPNLYGPQPGVVLQVHSPHDCSAQLRQALKEGGQRVGLIVGFLAVETAPVASGLQTTATFATPTPALGVELARAVVDGLNALASGAADWDEEDPLWDLGQRRRASALPLATLQQIAEAQRRGVPSFVRPDGRLQLGYGVRGQAIAIVRPSTGPSIPSDQIGVYTPARPAQTALPWAQLGPIPIIALSGPGHAGAARRLAALLSASGAAVALAGSASFATARALLADPQTQLAVIGLNAASLAQHGLPFGSCSHCALLGLPARLPPDVADRAELARLLGLPALVTDPRGSVALLIDQPELAALAGYAAAPLTLLSTRPDHPLLEQHRRQGGSAVFARNDTIIAAEGAAEQPLAPASATPARLPGLLAALALARAIERA